MALVADFTQTSVPIDAAVWPFEEATPENRAPGRGSRGPRQVPRPELRIHPNILRDYGEYKPDCPLSSNRPPKLFVPQWSVMVVHTEFDGTAQGFLSCFLRQLRQQIAQGRDRIQMLGEHAHMGRLFDQHDFEAAPTLSKWAARLAHSIKRTNYNMAVFASMHLFWLLARWMINPSLDHFEATPEWMRPVPNQLFMPHPMMVGFVIWPALREHVVQYPSMHLKVNWLLDVVDTITCHWPFPVEDAFCRHQTTNKDDLTQHAMLRVASYILLGDRH